MAKKKIDEQLVDTETGEILNDAPKQEKAVLNKAFASLKDYKTKINFVETKYKRVDASHH